MGILFTLLFFFLPLIFLPFTSELFEFNKIITLYIFTTLIVAAWMIRCIAAKKFLFRRTILDIPLLVFLSAMLLSTITSIDFRTSLLGYYSRFNGGLLSAISYTLLYWAFVSNINKNQVLSTTAKRQALLIRYTLYAGILVSIYGILQHFGIDKNLWVQDVQNRVFSTLGQPNWLAAYLAALMPLAWCNSIYNSQFTIFNQFSKYKILNSKTIWGTVSILFFITLLFTKSRSGLIGFAVADIIYWGFILGKYKKRFIKKFIILNSLFIILAIAIGTPWTKLKTISSAPALEGGGTESGQIRKIVWRGAIEIFKHYPLLGTGVETFAFAYQQFKPAEHNLTSEWDFIYNKAHNEYLNFLATTGLIGLVAYIFLIGAATYQIIKSKNYALLAGFASILVTNFFGFSVVATSLLFFLFPAMAIVLANHQPSTINYQPQKTLATQKILLLTVVCCLLYVVSRIAGYWYADFTYAKAKTEVRKGQPALARSYFLKAISLSPEPIFYYDLSLTSANLALAAPDLFQQAILEAKRGVKLSPNNVNLKRALFIVYLKSALLTPDNYLPAIEILNQALEQAPTDAKLSYYLALTYEDIGNTNQALSLYDKTISLKPNYKEARYSRAMLNKKLGNLEAVIDPQDKLIKEIFESLK